MRTTSQSSPGLSYTRIKATQGFVLNAVTFGTGFVFAFTHKTPGSRHESECPESDKKVTSLYLKTL